MSEAEQATIPHRLGDMQRRANTRAVLLLYLTNLLPIAALCLAASLYWLIGHTPELSQLPIFLLMYLSTLVGAEIGYHRYFAHSSFRTSRQFEKVLAILGAMSFQGGIIWWVATHRQHHAHADREGDPHSPHGNATEKHFFSRLWHAHLGWILAKEVFRPTPSQYATAMYRDKWLLQLNTRYYLWGLVGLMIPAALGFVLTGTPIGALDGFLWGGLLRVLVVNHAMYSLNSLCHTMGSRPYNRSKDLSTNNLLVALVCLGAGWHNNHHGFPRAASLQFKWWQIDFGGWIVRVLEWLGVVWDVHRPSPIEQPVD